MKTVRINLTFDLAVEGDDDNPGLPAWMVDHRWATCFLRGLAGYAPRVDVRTLRIRRARRKLTVLPSSTEDGEKR